MHRHIYTNKPTFSLIKYILFGELVYEHWLTQAAATLGQLGNRTHQNTHPRRLIQVLVRFLNKPTVTFQNLNGK